MPMLGTTGLDWTVNVSWTPIPSFRPFLSPYLECVKYLAFTLGFHSNCHLLPSSSRAYPVLLNISPLPVDPRNKDPIKNTTSSPVLQCGLRLRSFSCHTPLSKNSTPQSSVSRKRLYRGPILRPTGGHRNGIVAIVHTNVKGRLKGFYCLDNTPVIPKSSSSIPSSCNLVTIHMANYRCGLEGNVLSEPMARRGDFITYHVRFLPLVPIRCPELAFLSYSQPRSI